MRYVKISTFIMVISTNFPGKKHRFSMLKLEKFHTNQNKLVTNKGLQIGVTILEGNIAMRSIPRGTPRGT